MSKALIYEKLDEHVFVTKLAGFEHTEYIQGVATHKPVLEDDIPMVQGKNIRNGFFVNSFDWYISKDVSDSLPRSILNKPCLLIPYVGSNLGEIGVFPNEFTCHLASNVAKVELITNNYILEYIKYYLQSDIGQAYLFQSKQGSAQPNITMESIRDTFIIKRDINDQKKICGILAAMDEKIQLNEKVCRELESMAKTIYDYWFTQFDFPNEECKPYRSSGGEMVWNEQLKREIPKGWSVDLIGNILAKAPNRIKIQANEYKEQGKIPVIDQSSEFIVGYTDEPAAVLAAPNGFVVFGDHTRVVKYVRFPFARGADGTQILKSNTVCVPDELLYQIIKNVDLSNYGYARHFKFLKDTLAVIPSQKVAEQYVEIVTPIHDKQVQITFENIELKKLRDWLLPMLMNGQATVE